jgi:excisionase family DNA binding protein
MKNYESLKLRYENYISLEEFCKIIKAAKRTGRYLIVNGIVPAIDTGKNTWRYRIHIEDAIAYLRQRDQYGSMIPMGELTSRKNKVIKRRSYSQTVKPGCENEVADYFSEICSNKPDVLAVADIAEMTGLCRESVMRMLRAGQIRHLMTGRACRIPKAYFLEFVGSWRFIGLWSNAEGFALVLEGYEKLRKTCC